MLPHVPKRQKRDGRLGRLEDVEAVDNLSEFRMSSLRSQNPYQVQPGKDLHDSGNPKYDKLW